MHKRIKIGMVAGEASGDLLGAKLITGLRPFYDEIILEGVGGAHMQDTGFHSLLNIERLSVMGFIEPLLSLPDLLQARRQLYKHFIQNPPDVFIGIDAPEFNTGLELKLRRKGIKIIHYVSPSVWAWRPNRIKKIKKAVDLMLTLFPFEEEIYHQNNIPVKCVGHPLAQQFSLVPDKTAARQALCLDENTCYVGLLPGSRRQELAHLAEPYLRAAQLIWKQNPHVKFLTSHLNEERYQEFFACYKKIAPELPLQFFTRRAQDVMLAANALVITSGTATLEAMLSKTPMVIAYKMPKISYALAKRIVKTPFIGLPNILAKEMLVPELIQDAVQPETIAAHIHSFLNDTNKINHLHSRFIQLHAQSLPVSDKNLHILINNLIKKQHIL